MGTTHKIHEMSPSPSYQDQNCGTAPYRHGRRLRLKSLDINCISLELINFGLSFLVFTVINLSLGRVVLVSEAYNGSEGKESACQSAQGTQEIQV